MPFLAKEGRQVAPHAAVVRAVLVRAIQLGVALAERQPRARVVSAIAATQLARGLEPLGVTVNDPLEVRLNRCEHLRRQDAGAPRSRRAKTLRAARQTAHTTSSELDARSSQFARFCPSSMQ